MIPEALLVLALMTGEPAFPLPHTALESSVPAADSTVTGEVREIRLRFTTAVQLALSGVTVIGPRGAVAVGAVEAVEGTEDAEIRVALGAPLPSGTYTVEWRTAGPDSHVIRGSLDFSVELPVVGQDTVPRTRVRPSTAPIDVPDRNGGPGGTPYGLGGLAATWLFFVSVAGMIGTVLFRVAVVGRIGPPDVSRGVVDSLQRRTVALAGLIAALAVAALPVRLAHQAYLVAGSTDELGATAFMLMGSAWGSAWMVQVAGVGLFVVGLLLARSDAAAPGSWGVMALGAATAAVVPGLSGHAAANGVLILATDTAHVAAAGAWMGGLACLVLVGLPVVSKEPPALSPLVAQFTRLALPAVSALVLTGLINSQANVALGQLLTTPYGRLLLIKVIGAIGAFSLGYYNWRFVRPSLAQDPRPGVLRIPATVELAAGVTILALTAALVVTARP